MANERFTWQEPGKPWRGPAIYHVTIAAYKREALFATLSGSAERPVVEKTDLGWALVHNLSKTCEMVPEVKILADQVMPDHLHLVVQVTATMERGIKEVIRGYMQGCRAEARKAGRENPLFDGKPFFRPLVGKGQLRAMIDYTKDNPRRAVLRRDNANLFRLHRQTTIQIEERTPLVFTSLGNHFLMRIPTRRMVACSRSMSETQISVYKQQILAEAERGVIIYTAAISEGEKQIARAVREAGCPIVILLKDGFPKPGSEHEKYYKPGGVYFEACAAGRLLLLEPTEEAYTAPAIRQATEAALRAKAEARHLGYMEIPTTSARYRFMALNEMARMMAADGSGSGR